MNAVLKVLGVLCIVFTITNVASFDQQSHVGQKDAEVQNVLDDFIMAIINSFKDVIVDGNECLGIKPLDPFFLEGFPLNITNQLLRVQGEVRDVSSIGLKSLEVTYLSCNLITLAVNLVMEMPSFYIGGHYNIDGLAAIIFPIYGQGPFSLDIGGFKINGAGALGARLNGSLYMKELDFTIEIGTMQIVFEGLLGGGELGDVLNQLIDQLGLAVFNRVKAIIHDTLMSSLLQFINYQLKDVLLSDIIGGIIKPPDGPGDGDCLNPTKFQLDQ